MALFKIFAVVGLSHFFSTTQSGEVLPPQNVSVKWTSDFDPLFTWDPPRQPKKNCSYEWEFCEGGYCATTKQPSYTTHTVMDGGNLHFTVQTLCGNNTSEIVKQTVSYPELLKKKVICYVYSSTNTNCSWDLNIPEADFRFFYRLMNEDGTKPNNGSLKPALQECSSYSYTDKLKTGCDVSTRVKQSIHILFNGTVNGTFFRNTFDQLLMDDVRPPPLNWTVKKDGNMFDINWVSNEIDYTFERYLINYTECNIAQEIIIQDFNCMSTQLEIVPHCDYSMTIQALHRGFSTPLSEEKYFVAEKNPNLLVLAAVIIPIIFVVLAIVASICFKKNQDLIFPKIPIPRDFLTGVLDTSKSTVSKVYIPEGDPEENCNIVLVMDSQTKNLHL